LWTRQTKRCAGRLAISAAFEEGGSRFCVVRYPNAWRKRPGFADILPGNHGSRSRLGFKAPTVATNQDLDALCFQSMPLRGCSGAHSVAGRDIGVGQHGGETGKHPTPIRVGGQCFDEPVKVPCSTRGHAHVESGNQSIPVLKRSGGNFAGVSIHRENCRWDTKDYGSNKPKQKPIIQPSDSARFLLKGTPPKRNLFVLKSDVDGAEREPRPER